MTDEGAEPLLSSDETEALLQVMRSGAGTAASAKDVDLSSSDERLRKSLQRADDVARLLAAEVKRNLRRVLGLAYGVHESAADVVPYSVFASSLSPGTTVALLRSHEPCSGFITLGPTLTARILSRRLGASLASGGGEEEPRRALSPVDRRILKPLCQQMLDTFLALWGEMDAVLTLSDVLAGPQDAPRVPQFEPLLRIPLTVQLSLDLADEVAILLSSSSVRARATKTPAPSEAAASTEDRSRMAARLTSAEVELVATLGRTRSTVREVLGLAIGDVLRLDEAPETPVRVSVEGLKKLLGVPVVHHGNIAIQVVDVLKGSL